MVCMTQNKEWEKLSPYRQARMRTEMWLGSRDPHTQTVLEYEQTGPVPVETTWVPALFTAFREVFDNALDEVAAHGNGDRVDVTYDPKKMIISIQDNGRGVPIEFDEKEQKHAATVLLGETNAGRNFKDDRGATRGLNGVGGAIVNWCSEYFQVDIVRDNKEFSQCFREGEEHVVEEPIIFGARKKQTGTRIEFLLSSKVFKHRILPESFIRSRVYEGALCYPGVKIFYNGSRVTVKSVEKDLFPKHKPITFEIDEVGFKSRFWLVPDFFDDGRDHSHSLVNAIPMFAGGVHLDAFRNGFYTGLLGALESTSKRRKLKPSRSDINDGMLIYNITEMDSPNFDGQAKTRLVNEKVGKLIQNAMNDPDFFKSVIRRYPEWIENIYERCAERTMKKDNADLAKAGRANKRLKIVELEDAVGTARMDCTLFLCEGKCVDENTDIHVLRNGEFIPLPAREVIKGDVVLTHTNSMKTILRKSSKVSTVVSIATSYGSIQVSPEHRLLVWNPVTDVIEWEEARNISPNHRLVRNKLVDSTGLLKITTIEPIKHDKYHFRIQYHTPNGIQEELCTEDHVYGVMDLETMQYVKIEAKFLDADQHALIMR